MTHNHSGETTRKRSHGHKEESRAHFSFEEKRFLRDQGQANNDFIIFLARSEVASHYPELYGSADDVTSAVLNGTIPKDHLDLLVQLRNQFLSEH